MGGQENTSFQHVLICPLHFLSTMFEISISSQQRGLGDDRWVYIDIDFFFSKLKVRPS